MTSSHSIFGRNVADVWESLEASFMNKNANENQYRHLLRALGFLAIPDFLWFLTPKVHLLCLPIKHFQNYKNRIYVKHLPGINQCTQFQVDIIQLFISSSVLTPKWSAFLPKSCKSMTLVLSAIFATYSSRMRKQMTQLDSWLNTGPGSYLFCRDFQFQNLTFCDLILNWRWSGFRR